MNVADVMTQPVLSVTARTTLRDAAAVMATHGVSGLPVVDDHDRVVGVVSESDVLAKQRTPRPRRAGLAGRAARARQGALAAKASAVTVADAMTTPAVTVEADVPVASAASLLLEREVERLPVVDGEGRLLGIVTRADLVREVAASSERRGP